MRGWGWVVTGSYSGFILLVLVSPSPDLPAGAVHMVAEALGLAGAPQGATAPHRVEFALNALIIVPIAAAGRVRFSGTSWRDWTAWTFVASAGIEAFQGLVLAGRSATFVDIAANTTGALAGVLAVSGIKVLRQVRAAHAAQSAA